jgi:hypothetical protein
MFVVKIMENGHLGGQLETRRINYIWMDRAEIGYEETRWNGVVDDRVLSRALVLSVLELL